MKKAWIGLGVIAVAGAGAIALVQLSSGPTQEQPGPVAKAKPAVPSKVISTPVAPGDIVEPSRDRGRGEFGRRGGRPGEGRFDMANLTPEQRERMEARRKQMEERRQQWMLDRFDADGDGVLSDEERAAMEQMFAERRAKQLAEARNRVNDMFGGEMDFTDEELGQLGRMVMGDMMRSMRGSREELMKAADADGDGEITGDERQQARAMMEQRMEAQFEKLAERNRERYDIDADGQLNDFEREQAADQIRTQLDQRQTMRRVDGNRNGAIDPDEVIDFMSNFGGDSDRADLNRDGQISSEDLDRFKQLLEDGDK